MSGTDLQTQQRVAKLLERLCGTGGQAAAGQTQPQVVVCSNTTKPPLYALLIGINDYETITKLKAAVPDIKEFKNYLMNDLLVPEDQITMILDKQCTRAGIISAFQNLAKDPRIKKDDPIVIYYAGHGSEIDPPPDRAINGPLVQCIIPQDTSKITGVVPIPDFTLGALITQLSNEKGDNITLIFDCCHSAGGTRDDEGARYIDKGNLPTLPPKPDAELIEAATGGTRALVEAEGFANAGMASHILLAACAHGEVAFENGRECHGYFSTALLKLLRSMKVDNLTYKGCMQRLPTLKTRQPQNPVCEGKNIDRFFFNAKVPGASNQFIAIKQDDFGKNWLQAGVAQGITPGCTFAVHKDHVIGESNPSIGTFIVDQSEPFRALLKLPPGASPIDIGEIAYGRQTGYGADHALNVCLTDEFVNAAKQDEKWRLAFSGGENNVLLRPTDRDLADLIVDINKEGKTTFTTSNSSAIEQGIPRLPYTVEPTPEEVIPALNAAGRWNYHLRRQPGERPFQKSVQVEFFKLSRSTKYDDQGNPVLLPEGNNLNVGGVADICVPDPPPGQKRDIYGFNIKNNSSRDLYAYMFCFSCTDLSITPYFTKVIGSGKVDPPLPQGQSLTLGYGSGGERPAAFKLAKDQDCDVGIFKLFITTEWTDFDSIAQDTPFGETRAPVSDDEVEDMIGKQPLWDVITMTLVQRRYPKEQMSKPQDDPFKQPQGAGTTSEPGKPATAPVAGAGLFTGRSDGPQMVQSISPNPNQSPWFRSPPLTKEVLDSLSGMRLRTLGRAQAPGNANATDNNTWFDLWIIDSNDEPRYDPNDMPFEYKSHSSPRGNDPAWTDGVVFDRGHQIWKNVKPGDRLEVVACSKGRGWSNVAQEGNLIFW